MSFCIVITAEARGNELQYLLRRRSALVEQRVGSVDDGRGLAPHAADAAAARVHPFERVGDPRPPLDEHPDVPRLHLLAPRASPPGPAGDGSHGGRGGRVGGADLGADTGAPDGGVPGAESGEDGGEGVPLAGADGVERRVNAGALRGGGDDGAQRGGEGGCYGGELEVAGEEDKQDGGGGEHRGHVAGALRHEHRGGGHPEKLPEAPPPLAGAGDLGGGKDEEGSTVVAVRAFSENWRGLTSLSFISGF